MATPEITTIPHETTDWDYIRERQEAEVGKVVTAQLAGTPKPEDIMDEGWGSGC